MRTSDVVIRIVCAGEAPALPGHLHIHSVALAALAFLIQAIQSESATAGIVNAVAEHLRRAEHEPFLPFRIPE